MLAFKRRRLRRELGLVVARQLLLAGGNRLSTRCVRGLLRRLERALLVRRGHLERSLCLGRGLGERGLAGLPLDLDVLRVLFLERREIGVASGDVRGVLVTELRELLLARVGLGDRALGATLEVLAGLLRLLLVGLERLELVLALGELTLLLEDLVVEIRLESLERERLVTDIDDLLVLLRERFAKGEDLLVLLVERLAEIEEIAARDAARLAGCPCCARRHETRLQILVVLAKPLDLGGVIAASAARVHRVRACALRVGACGLRIGLGAAKRRLELANLVLGGLDVALESGGELRCAVVVHHRRRMAADASGRAIARARNRRFACRSQRVVERSAPVSVRARSGVSGDGRTRRPSGGNRGGNLLDDDVAVELLGLGARRRDGDRRRGRRGMTRRVIELLVARARCGSGLEERGEGLDTREQVAKGDRLVDVVLGARPELAMLLERLVARLARHDDERDVLERRILLQLVAHREAVHARQLDGQEDEVRRRRGRLLEAGVSIVDDLHGAAELGQLVAQVGGEGRIAFEDEDFLSHGAAEDISLRVVVRASRRGRWFRSSDPAPGARLR